MGLKWMGRLNSVELNGKTYMKTPFSGKSADSRRSTHHINRRLIPGFWRACQSPLIACGQGY